MSKPGHPFRNAPFWQRRRAAFAMSAAVLFPALALTACSSGPPDPSAPVLLFNGTGVSRNDVAAVESILKEKGLRYSTVSSAQLNAMSAVQLGAHRLLIVPGGNYIKMGDHLTPEATSAAREAVRGGLNYLGICAGGILAGNAPVNSLNLTSGVRFGFYAVVNQNVHLAAVNVSRPGVSDTQHYWEDGPCFTGWGAVAGKYPDGTPAIAQGAFGKGWVVLCGTHPEALDNWRDRVEFTTPGAESRACAAELIDAALNATPLPRF